MSMTIQQAIENRERCYNYLLGCGPRASNENVEAVRLSLEALREKAEREDPKPLTYYDLQSMHGEPVYVTVPGKSHRNKWCIVDLTHPQPGLRGVEYSCSFDAVALGGVKVYRHKPKEVSK